MKKLLSTILLLFVSICLFAQNYLIFIAGQSNALGNALPTCIGAEYTGNINNCYAWTGSQFDTLNLTDHNNNQYPSHGGQIGVEMSLQYRLINTYKYSAVYMAKYAVGSTYLCNTATPASNWNPNTNNSYFDLSKVVFKNAKNNLVAQGKTFTSVFLWIQGEQDANDSACAADYYSNLAMLVDSMRIYTGLPNMLFINVKLNKELSSSYTYRATVWTADETYSLNYPTSYMVIPDNLGYDHLHYTCQGYIDLGKLIADVLVSRNKRDNGYYHTPLIY